MHFRSLSSSSNFPPTSSPQTTRRTRPRSASTNSFVQPQSMDVNSATIPKVHNAHAQQKRRSSIYMNNTSSQQIIGAASLLPSGRPASGTAPMPAETTFPKDTPAEMIPILTLLSSHQVRNYTDGYFMILSDLNADGKPVTDRRWVEVYGKLVGTVLSIWDADALNEATAGEPTPTYINITDSTFKAIDTLPSPSGELENIIVLSTTMKNRFLLQFSSQELLNSWSASLRLSVFEYTSLQEAYTGALLSSKGSKLNGIRTLLAETKHRHEDWVSVRFGSGMPWKKCWTVITPDDKKKKKPSKGQPPSGTISFYEDKKMKKGPLAVVAAGTAAYAVYPMRSVLVNNSTLIKLEAKVSFTDSNDVSLKDASVFLMPEAHPGVLGFETLIRFLIPVLDVFKLYGRPARLNADKSDKRSLLFGMPTLPKNQYLEVEDVVMIVSLQGSDRWTQQDWTSNIKDLLARKIATGYKGCGGLNLSSPVTSPTMTSDSEQRSVSAPVQQQQRAAPLATERQAMAIHENNSQVSITSGSSYSGNGTPNFSRGPASPATTPVTGQFPSTQRPPVVQAQRVAPPPPGVRPMGPRSPIPPPEQQQRSASQGQPPNNLMGRVDYDTQPLSPVTSLQRERDAQREGMGSRQEMRGEIFGREEPQDAIAATSGRVSPLPTVPQQPVSPQPPKDMPRRRPVSGTYEQASTPAQPNYNQNNNANMFNPANTYDHPEYKHQPRPMQYQAPPNAQYQQRAPRPQSPRGMEQAPQAPYQQQGMYPVRSQSPYREAPRAPVPQAPFQQQARSQSPYGPRSQSPYGGPRGPRQMAPPQGAPPMRPRTPQGPPQQGYRGALPPPQQQQQQQQQQQLPPNGRPIQYGPPQGQPQQQNQYYSSMLTQ